MGQAKRRGTYEERKAIAETRDARIREYLPNHKRSSAKPSPTLLGVLALAAIMGRP